MNIIIKEEIGRGKDGIVYLTQDNLILKVSSDSTEALIALTISELQHRQLLGDSFPYIMGAWAENGQYYILRENVADGQYTPLQLEAINFFAHGWTCQEDWSIKEALSREPQLYELLEDLQTVFEYSGIRIKDISSHNNVAGNFVLRDLSRASGVNLKNKTWKKNNKFKIVSREEAMKLNAIAEQKKQDVRNRLISYVQTELSTAFTNLAKDVLESIFSNKDELEKIKPTLYDFIEKYDSTNGFTFWQQRMFPFLLNVNELKILLEDNVFYQLNNMGKREELTLEKFDVLFEKVRVKYYKQEISIESAEEYLNKLKMKLPISYLIEQKMPKKELFKYLEKKKLNEDLQESLETGIKIKRTKI